MKHETTLYRGEAAVAYARRNLGAFLVADPELEVEYGHRLWNLEFNPAQVERIFTQHGTEGFTLCGGVSDAHDEAFFLWLIQEHDHLRARIFSKDFSGTLYTTFDDEDPGDIGVDVDLIELEDYTDVASMTLEGIGRRLAREGKVRALEAGDGYEFILPDAPPLKVWAVVGSSKENAVKALDVHKPAAVDDDDFYGMAINFPMGRLE